MPCSNERDWGSHLGAMERLRIRDLGSIPGLLSLMRAPLAVAFPFATGKPIVALAVVALAAVSDMLDGFSARRLGGATATGAILDPLMDKLFVAVVVVTLLLNGQLSLRAALFLGARDIIQLPLLIWLVADSESLSSRAGRVRANVFGKLVTALQFGTIAAALFAASWVDVLALASAASGVIAGASTWLRMLERGSPAARN